MRFPGSLWGGIVGDVGARILRLERAKETFEFATLARERFQNANPQKRREFVAALSGDSNLLLSNKTLSLTKTGPLFVIREAVKYSKELKPGFEPRFDTMGKRKGHPLGVANSRWLAYRDSLRLATKFKES